MAKYLKILMLILLFQTSHSCINIEPENKKKNSVVEKNPEIKNLKPINYKDFPGKWVFMYKNNYGFKFIFDESYKSIIIIYLSDRSIIFKGVYSIIDKNRFKVNIVGMKRELRVSRLNLKTKFMDTKTSSFIFRGNFTSKNRSRYLTISPEKILIDGSNSQGYFEKLIKLKKR